jgi:hypothetical protein
MPIERFCRGLITFWLVLLVLGSSSRAQEQGKGPVYVILWFDTEDYLLPADDDASKRLAEMLTSKGIRATFKIVGEKARTMEKRGRSDVIAALKKHDIGYHANFHSVHPTPSEYLAEAGLLDGMAEFTRREGPGAADVRRILGVSTLACYGQPGSSWAAQTIAALKDIGVAPQGVPCYVDEGTHIGLNEQPFWFENALVVYHMGQNYTRMELYNPAAVQPAQEKFSTIAERLRNQGGGLISIFYHPCEWVHQKFWDGVNFSRGENPPREEWKAPPQRPLEETEGAFKRFEQYVDHIKASGVQFVTASDLPKLYADPARNETLPPKALISLAEAVAGGSNTVNFVKVNGNFYSAAEQLELLTRATAHLIRGNSTAAAPKLLGLFGPEAPPPQNASKRTINWPAFRQTILDVEDYIKTQHRVPARVFIGPDTISPADYLHGVATAYLGFGKNHWFPESIEAGQNSTNLAEKYVAKDTPDLFGDWVIHKAGFRAPKILEIARLQTWTLKPAVLAGSTKE